MTDITSTYASHRQIRTNGPRPRRRQLSYLLAKSATWLIKSKAPLRASVDYWTSSPWNG